MPHQCANCGKLYQEGSREVLDGCGCAGKIFFYIQQDKLKTKEAPFILTSAHAAAIEKDVYDMMGNDFDREKPIVLDLESINVEQQGKYEIDLANLMKKGHPLVYKIRDGKYYIDIRETFRKIGDGKKKK